MVALGSLGGSIQKSLDVMGVLPFKYPCIPMHHRKLQNLDRKEVEERFQKKLSGWKRKMLSVGGRFGSY
jgi:hypothetical protein